MRNVDGVEVAARMQPSLILSDLAAMREAALLGLGIALLAVPDVLPWLERGN